MYHQPLPCRAEYMWSCEPAISSLSLSLFCFNTYLFLSLVGLSTTFKSMSITKKKSIFQYILNINTVSAFSHVTIFFSKSHLTAIFTRNDISSRFSFTSNNTPYKFPYSLRGVTVQNLITVKNAIYTLGIIFISKLSFAVQVKIIVNETYRNLGMIT